MNEEHETPDQPFDPAAITRPDEKLLRYYVIIGLFTLIGFPFFFAVHFCKYITLRYAFDDEGVSMAWGVLFKREINLTYRRIQDIHITQNIIQRHLGLATVGIQTASAGSGPEMSIEGILQPGKLRDFLYARMRGARENAQQSAGEPDEVLALLHEIRDALAALRTRDPGGAPE